MKGIKTTKTTPKKELMIETLQKCLGIVTTACLKVGLNRSTHYGWLKEDPDYKARVDEVDDLVIDFAESQLHKSIQNGSDTATIFFLKTKGKRRGYVERSETIQTNINTDIEVSDAEKEAVMNKLKEMLKD